LLDRAWVGELREELKALGAALGVVRDLDVLGERFDAQAARLAGPAYGDRLAAAGSAALAGRLRRAHAAATEDLAAVLASSRYLDLLAALEEPVRWASDASGGGPAADVAGRLVRKPWRRLARTVAALPDEPADDELHQVRLRAKQVRYAAHAVAPVVGEPAVRLADRAKALQQVLGDHQDAVAATTWLQDAVTDGAGAEEAWFAGQAALLDAEDRRMARQAWVAAWTALDHRSLRRWLR
jgi:CHAD domain-containing protein